MATVPLPSAPITGAPGASARVVPVVDAKAPVPAGAFTAATWKVNAVRADRPDTVMPVEVDATCETVVQGALPVSEYCTV